MIPRETGNNAHANFWRRKTKSITVFLMLANERLIQMEKGSFTPIVMSTSGVLVMKPINIIRKLPLQY